MPDVGTHNAALRDVPLELAIAVASEAHEKGLAGTTPPPDLRAAAKESRFVPAYVPYV